MGVSFSCLFAEKDDVEASLDSHKLLDFGELKRSCISFFDIKKHEIANSGGLDLGQEQLSLAKPNLILVYALCCNILTLRHWYGHNIYFYYKLLRCQSRVPYFYWFDIDEGEEVNLVEKCPQLKLQQQCINHIGPLLRLLWKTRNSSTRTVEKCFKLLLWKIVIPNGFGAQHIDSVVRWGEEGYVSTFKLLSWRSNC
ncbi:hypothetical protein HID58_061097 [Brassica napus]|uniref:(rape) hypothetical protein n=1 Tax=Brassica napus TaxID=3708 RepID=A0A078JJL8_BRANA|nr:hypothetical protein HID58_061097 [Brassica napus]CAF1853779.1 unnamed protein product [Brassica napus]CDY67738.1 BnaUnng02470D [Brassica napus]